ncbi:large ribosomal subunit protein mL37 [Prorops nasuta]|uniref:large ribosomal subunit protein mL37 n=1 Tax=Prorops nasuta TaxID=863751 RepID=UPI0034CEBCBA
MRLNTPLWAQHLGRLRRLYWVTHNKRTPITTNVEEHLKENHKILNIQDALEFVQPKKKKYVKIEHFNPKKIPDPTEHPDWKEKIAFTYRNFNVLQEGVKQAQLLTNTIRIGENLPRKIEDLISEVPNNVHTLVRRAISSANIFDAHQELLPKRHDPSRPAWIFPREMGLTNIRRVRTLSRKLLLLCEKMAGFDLVKTRLIVENCPLNISLERDSTLLNFLITSDIWVMSLKPLSAIEDKSIGFEYIHPDFHPLHPNISLVKSNIYKHEDFYPLKPGSPWKNVHTIFIYHDPEEVKNLTELPVTEDQKLSRYLVKAFVAAAGCARQKYGDVKELPEPLTIQCVFSDGREFYFGVYQLNTLDIGIENRTKNFWWCSQKMQLFEKAEYEIGRPVLLGYNPKVFQIMYALYKNV